MNDVPSSHDDACPDMADDFPDLPIVPVGVDPQVAGTQPPPPEAAATRHRRFSCRFRRGARVQEPDGLLLETMA